VCVTDGVGSEPLSHRGAAEACQLLRDAVAADVADFFKGPKQLTRAAWAEMAGVIGDRLIAVAGYLGVAPRALSTTLAAALVELNPADPARRRFVILNVGDATAFVLSDQAFAPLLADPHDGTITSTATYALPTSVGDAGVDAGMMGPGDMLMVCTDGMSNPMRNDNVRAQLAEWWGSRKVPGLPEFGWQMSYRAKTYDDDRTAVCIWGT
jgi:serine/threonine protein phosphatase PrpC